MSIDNSPRLNLSDIPSKARSTWELHHYSSSVAQAYTHISSAVSGAKQRQTYHMRFAVRTPAFSAVSHIFTNYISTSRRHSEVYVRAPRTTIQVSMPTRCGCIRTRVLSQGPRSSVCKVGWIPHDRKAEVRMQLTFPTMP